jgi:uncharacterized protein YbaR (Trm112 family)
MSGGPMTEHDRALWVAAKEDYKHALAIAGEAWGGGVPHDVIQAATATVLIHITKLRQEERIHVRVPTGTAAPRPAVVPMSQRGLDSSQAAAAVPPCPKCKGSMRVNAEKRSEKSPDFICEQEKGDCGTPSKDKKKWFPTGAWIDKLPPRNGANTKPVPAGSYDDMPPALDDEGDTGLPF